MKLTLHAVDSQSQLLELTTKTGRHSAWPEKAQWKRALRKKKSNLTIRHPVGWCRHAQASWKQVCVKEWVEEKNFVVCPSSAH